MLDELEMKFRTRVLLGPQTSATGTEYYAKPTAGVQSIVVRAIVKMGNSTDLVLSLKYADDAAGTTATAFDAASPLFVDGLTQIAAKTYTVTASSGNFIVDFIVDPALVPAGKYVGLSFATSNAGNLLTTVMLEKMGVQPTAT